MAPRTVYVLEDHPRTQAQLARAIEADPRLTLAGAASTLGDAKGWRDAGGQADAVLVDLGLPDGEGTEFIRHLCSRGPAPAILVITAFGDEKHVISAIEAGATGYLLKERDPEHIVDSILTVLDGGSPISPSIARHLLKRFKEEAAADAEPKVTLTDREADVLRLVVKGFSYKDIAENLELSVHTVTSHIQHIYRKLSVHSRGEAVFEAIQLGLVDIR